MASEDTPALSRLTGFVRAVAELLPDATNAVMVAEEDGDEAAAIRELVAEHFGGKVADIDDAEVAIVDALDVLEGKLAPDRAPHLKAGKLGAALIKLVEDHERALVTLHQIYARARNTGSTPSDRLPDDLRPVDVLIEVDAALITARLWSGQRGVA